MHSTVQTHLPRQDTTTDPPYHFRMLKTGGRSRLSKLAHAALIEDTMREVEATSQLISFHNSRIQELNTRGLDAKFGKLAVSQKAAGAIGILDQMRSDLTQQAERLTNPLYSSLLERRLLMRLRKALSHCRADCTRAMAHQYVEPEPAKACSRMGTAPPQVPDVHAPLTQPTFAPSSSTQQRAWICYGPTGKSKYLPTLRIDTSGAR